MCRTLLKTFYMIESLNPPKPNEVSTVISPLYRYGTSGTEKLNNLPDVTLLKVRARMWTQQFGSQL